MTGSRHEPPTVLEAGDISIGNVGLLDTNEAEINPAIHALFGKTLVRANIPTTAVGAGGIAEIIVLTAAQVIYVVEISITTDTQTKLELVTDTASAKTPLGTWYFPAMGGIAFASIAPGMAYRFAGTSAKNLGFQSSAAINAAGHIIYYKE